MLLMDFKDDIILSVSGVTKKELEEIKYKNKYKVFRSR